MDPRFPDRQICFRPARAAGNAPGRYRRDCQLSRASSRPRWPAARLDQALPRRRVDRPSGRAPHRRQSHERVHPIPAGAHRRQADDQAVRRSRVVEARRREARSRGSRFRFSTACISAGTDAARDEDADFAREAIHPDHGPRTLDWFLQLYAWHGRHHIGHVRLTAG